MPSIATRTGDDGTTSLLFGQRVPKSHPQIETVGAFDELNAALGLAKANLPSAPAESDWREMLPAIQRNLVAVMGELACAESDFSRYQASKFEKLSTADVARLDEAVAKLESRGLKFEDWATPGANPAAAAFDIARTIARRAERRLIDLPNHGRSVRPELKQFINRLSDLLWLLARAMEQK
jgi:cob(I)alamin adenosyltransferase